jgi:hypothetical protein
VILTNVSSGDFWVEPTAWCGYSIVSDLQSNAVFTSTTLTATNASDVTTNAGQFTQTTYLFYTNNALVITPLTCTFTTDPARLREGVEKVQFIRASYDSLLGQYFQPITNNYTMTYVTTNSQAMIQHFQRVLTAPDILFSASDQASPNVPQIGLDIGSRNVNFDQGNILTGLAGPGVINPQTVITYDKVGPIWENGPVLSTNAFLGQNTQLGNFTNGLLMWASFDASTNPPVVYPDGVSIQNFENQVLIQISPASLPDGTNNVAYPATTFTTTGGGAFTPPFTWSVLGSTPLPAGLTLSSGGTISGTPTNNIPGTFDFIIQMSDSLTPPRTVQWNYSINIDY